MAPSRNSSSFSIYLYWAFSKSWSQIQKVGVNYSKYGVNETSVLVHKIMSICLPRFFYNGDKLSRCDFCIITVFNDAGG